MFVRKLKALNYPKAGSFQAHDEKSLRELVIWLEDEIFVTELPGQLASDLRQAGRETWNAVFRTYLQTCLCPFDASNTTECLDWLLREAIRLMIADRSEALGDLKVDEGAKENGGGVFGNVDVNDENFHAGVDKMAAMLHVPLHPDPTVTLQAIGILLEQQLTNQGWQHNQGGELVYPLDEVTLGFVIEDQALLNACRISRLLHLSRLRTLQTDMDIALVEVQSITANPQTDSALGRTGM